MPFHVCKALITKHQFRSKVCTLAGNKDFGAADCEIQNLVTNVFAEILRL